MKKFDRYSIRGIIFSTLALVGMLYELILSKPSELIVLILYALVIVLGLLLIFIIKYPKE